MNRLGGNRRHMVMVDDIERTLRYRSDDKQRQWVREENGIDMRMELIRSQTVRID